MKPAIIVAVSFIFLFFSPVTLVLWNAGMHLLRVLYVYTVQICKVMDFSVLTCTTDVLLLPQEFAKKQENQTDPWELRWALNQREQIQDTGRGMYSKRQALSDTITNNETKTPIWIYVNAFKGHVS